MFCAQRQSASACSGPRLLLFALGPVFGVKLLPWISWRVLRAFGADGDVDDGDDDDGDCERRSNANLRGGKLGVAA
jgi:hypothetical protein